MFASAIRTTTASRTTPASPAVTPWAAADVADANGSAIGRPGRPMADPLGAPTREAPSGGSPLRRPPRPLPFRSSSRLIRSSSGADPGHRSRLRRGRVDWIQARLPVAAGLDASDSSVRYGAPHEAALFRRCSSGTGTAPSPPREAARPSPGPDWVQRDGPWAAPWGSGRPLTEGLGPATSGWRVPAPGPGARRSATRGDQTGTGPRPGCCGGPSRRREHRNVSPGLLSSRAHRSAGRRPSHGSPAGPSSRPTSPWGGRGAQRACLSGSRRRLLRAARRPPEALRPA